MMDELNSQNVVLRCTNLPKILLPSPWHTMGTKRIWTWKNHLIVFQKFCATQYVCMVDWFLNFHGHLSIFILFMWSCNRTGESRGFAFVRYKYAEEAQKAVDRLDGTSLTFFFLWSCALHILGLFLILHGVLKIL